MLYFTSKLKTYNILATDGEMGKIKDVYFDDRKWAIRYAIVDTRKWLPGRRVLLSPTSFLNMNNESESLEVNYNKGEIRNSPEITDEQAISKDVEHSIAGYYGWNRYWTGNMLWGPQDRPLDNIKNEEITQEETRFNQQLEDQQEYDLRSENETMEFKVHANDGKLGKVLDMVYDDDYWKIRYIVVQSSESYLDKEYFVFKTEEIESVDWFEKDLYVKGTVEEAKMTRLIKTKEEIITKLQEIF